MNPEFGVLSLSLEVAPKGTAAPQLLTELLLGFVQRLGPGAAGHAKAVAQLPGGVVYASTTGVPLEVNVRTLGEPATVVDRLRVDVACVFYGLEQEKLEAAWRQAMDALSAEGFQVTTLQSAQSPKAGQGQQSPV